MYTGGIRVVETVGRLEGLVEGIFNCHEYPGAAGTDETCGEGFQTGSDGLGTLDKTVGVSCGIGASGIFGRTLGPW